MHMTATFPDTTGELPNRYLTKTTGPIIAIPYFFFTWIVSILWGGGACEWDLLWRLLLISSILWLSHVSLNGWLTSIGGCMVPLFLGMGLLVPFGYIVTFLAHALYVLSNLMWGTYLGMREGRKALWKDVQAYMEHHHLGTFSIHSWPAWMKYYHDLHTRRGWDTESGLLTDIEIMNILREGFSIDVEHKNLHYDQRIAKIEKGLRSLEAIITRDNICNLMPNLGNEASQQHEMGVRLLCQWFYKEFENPSLLFAFFDVRDVRFYSRLNRGGKAVVAMRFGIMLNFLAAIVTYPLIMGSSMPLAPGVNTAFELWFGISIGMLLVRTFATFLWQFISPAGFFLCQFQGTIDKVMTSKLHASLKSRMGILYIIAAEVAQLAPILGNFIDVKVLNDQPLAFQPMVPNKAPIPWELTAEFLHKSDKPLPDFLPNYVLTFASGQFFREQEGARVVGLNEAQAEKVRDFIATRGPILSSKANKIPDLDLKLEASGPSSYVLRFPRNTSLLHPSISQIFFD